MRKRMIGRLALGVIAMQAALLPMQAVAADDGRWVASWASSPSLPVAKLPFDFWEPAPEVQGTIRYHLRLSAGGTKVQVRLSGDTQPTDVAIGSATIALADADEYTISIAEQPGAPRFGFEVGEAPDGVSHAPAPDASAAQLAGRLRQLPARITIPITVLMREPQS